MKLYVPFQRISFERAQCMWIILTHMLAILGG